MTPLVGFGYNPTIVRAPEHLRRGGVEFIGTDRFEQNNKSVRAAGGGWGRSDPRTALRVVFTVERFTLQNARSTLATQHALQ